MRINQPLLESRFLQIDLKMLQKGMDLELKILNYSFHCSIKILNPNLRKIGEISKPILPVKLLSSKLANAHNKTKNFLFVNK
jgi:hypothetical protein